MLITQGQWVHRYLHLLVWLFRLILEDQLTYQSRYIPSALVTGSKLTLSEIYIFFVRLEFWHVLTIRYPWMIYIYENLLCWRAWLFVIFPWQDERELKREKRKQSNRESARRSKLRKQVCCFHHLMHCCSRKHLTCDTSAIYVANI